MKIFTLLLISIMLVQACNSKKEETVSAPNNFIDTAKTIDTTMGIITELSTDASNATEVIVAANQIYGQRFLVHDTLFYKSKYMADAVNYPVHHPMIQGRDSIGKYYYGVKFGIQI